MLKSGNRVRLRVGNPVGDQFRIIAIKVGFEVLTAVSMKMAVLWVVAPCSLVEVYQRFRGPCCLHHHSSP
jgi:hypothetical protein